MARKDRNTPQFQDETVQNETRSFTLREAQRVAEMKAEFQKQGVKDVKLAELSALAAVKKATENTYKNLSASRKIESNKQLAQELKNVEKENLARLQQLKVAKASTENEKEKEAIQKTINVLTENNIRISDRINSLNEKSLFIENAVLSSKKKQYTVEEQIVASQIRADRIASELKQKQDQLLNAKIEGNKLEAESLTSEVAELTKQKQKAELASKMLNASIKNSYSDQVDTLSSIIDDVESQKADLKKQIKDQGGKATPEQSQQLDVLNRMLKLSTDQRKSLKQKELQEKAQNSKVLKAIGETVKYLNKLSDKIDPYIETYTKYQSSILTRMQGIEDFSYKNVTAFLNTGFNKYFSSASYMEKFADLVDKGIAMNVEQRAFLSTISDRISTTFDVANSTMLRIIRLQQTDSTVYRLGLESSLNTYLNKMFEDTSYLNDVFDSVTDSLVEATSTMEAKVSAAFEFEAQKWLGALYSVGMSQSAISSISSGLSYLGSGNVSALSSNESLQTLMAMSLSRAGLSYGDILTSGLTGSETNKLLRSMVEYLGEIADSQNKVVQSEYASLLGISMSDLIAAKTLSSDSSTLASLSKYNLSAGDMAYETQNQLGLMTNRYSAADFVRNVYENILTSVGSGIASSPTLLATYRINDLISELLNGGVPVPSVGVVGNFFSMEGISINDLIKSGIIGYKLIEGLYNNISSIGDSTQDFLTLNNWSNLRVGGAADNLAAPVQTAEGQEISAYDEAAVIKKAKTSAAAVETQKSVDESQKSQQEAQAQQTTVLVTSFNDLALNQLRNVLVLGQTPSSVATSANQVNAIQAATRDAINKILSILRGEDETSPIPVNILQDSSSITTTMQDIASTLRTPSELR